MNNLGNFATNNVFATFVILLVLFFFFKAIYIVFFRDLVFSIINIFNPDYVFKAQLKIAETSEWYTYDGSMCMSEIRGYPQARVQYNDRELSRNMAIGNAVDYAEIFGGKVIKPLD